MYNKLAVLHSTEWYLQDHEMKKTEPKEVDGHVI